MNSDVEAFIAKLLGGFKPRTPIAPADWCNENRFLEPGAHKAGRFACYPFQVQPLNDMIDPSCSRITLCWASQLLGKSAVLTNAIGYFMAEKPSSILVVEPTETSASHFLRSRVNPMLESTPILAELIDSSRLPKRARAGGGRQLLMRKSFPGGWLLCGGSNSPAQLRSHAARVTIFDECDAFEQHPEGPVMTLVRQRSATFKDALSIAASTPTFKGQSNIEAEYELSNQSRWWIDCPYCNKAFVLSWSHIEWAKDKDSINGKTLRHYTETAHVQCPYCSAAWTERDRINAVTGGRWIAEHPEVTAHRGYRLSGLNVLLPHPKSKQSWCHEFADRWLEAKAQSNSGIMTFQNLVLGESYEVESEKPPEWQILMDRRETYEEHKGEVIIPAEVLILTAGVDLQKDRAIVSVIGFADGDETYGIAHREIYGDPSQSKIWNDILAFIRKKWRHASGHWVWPERIFVDAGDQPAFVYDFVHRAGGKVFASKGQRGYGPVWCKPSEGANRRLWRILVDAPKEVFYSRLRIETPGVGYCHFPVNRGAGFEEQYFRELTAEEMKWSYTRGQRVPYFEPKAKGGGSLGHPNHALDCFVLAMAARFLEHLDLAAIQAWYASPPDPDCDWLPGHQAPQEPVKTEPDKTIDQFALPVAKTTQQSKWVKPQKKSWLDIT